MPRDILQLTSAEERVYSLLLRGFTLTKIADILGNKYSTVNTHMNRIFQKKFVVSKQELLAQRIQELEKLLKAQND